MEKLVIIINGNGGVGKDTLCNIVAKHYPTMNVSSIDPIKAIARENGWNGEKDMKSRRFLAELKATFINYCDLPLQYLLGKYEEFARSTCQILFVQIREPEEIAKFKAAVPAPCVTLLIRGREAAQISWQNKSDDLVECYSYDYCYENVKPKKEIEQDFLQFFREMLVSEGL